MTDLKKYYLREQIILAVREFFHGQNFHEVITPILSKTVPLEPNIYPFETTWQRNKGKNKLFLATSPEGYFKKLIAKGLGDCFSIGYCFRNLENSGPIHHPEFLMLEWYRENADCAIIIEDTKNLIKFIKNKTDKYLGLVPNSILRYQKNKIDLSGKWQIFSLIDLFYKYSHCSLEEIIDDRHMIKVAGKKGYFTRNASWEQLFNQIFLNEIEPKIPLSPCFVTDFPARISPLCAVKRENKNLADRFEFYLSGIELANGNKENTDTKTVRNVFTKEIEYRKRKRLPAPLIDEEFLEALNVMKEKNYAGVGMGIDRLVMIFADLKNISILDPEINSG